MTTFRIAHLSDFHFKKKFNGWNYNGVMSWARKIPFHGHCEIAKDQILKAFKSSAVPQYYIDLLLVTGDVATTGSREDIEQGANFIQDLRGCGSVRRVAVIPGNHDRYDPIGRPGAVNFEDYYFKEHNKFSVSLLADMEKSRNGQNPARLIVLGLDLTINPNDTSIKVSPIHYLGGGAAYQQVLDKAVAITNFFKNNAQGYSGVYVVWACHFPPGADFTLCLYNEDRLKEAAQRAEINLALFGHTHESRFANMGASSIQGFVVSSTLGDPFVQKDRKLRAFSIIDINIEDEAVGKASPSYFYWHESGSSKDGTFQ